MHTWAHRWVKTNYSSCTSGCQSRKDAWDGVSASIFMCQVVEIPERCGDNCVHLDLSWGKVRHCLVKRNAQTNFHCFYKWVYVTSFDSTGLYSGWTFRAWPGRWVMSFKANLSLPLIELLLWFPEMLRESVVSNVFHHLLFTLQTYERYPKFISPLDNYTSYTK